MARGRKGLGVEALATAIRFKFTWNGETIRETVNREPTTANLKWAATQASNLRRDIDAGALDDERYARYFPESKRVKRAERADTFEQLGELYLATCGQLSANTRSSYKTIMRFWGRLLGADKPVADIRHSWLKAKIGSYPWRGWQQMSKYLVPLRAALALWVADAPHQRSNPMTGISCIKKVKNTEKIDKADAFSVADEAAVLQAIAARYEQQVYNYFDFAFATGLRPEEEIELKWGDCDLDGERPIARIVRARSLGEVRPPKNNILRNVELSQRAVEALRRQRAFTGEREDGYVFTNPETSKPWNSTLAQRKRWDRVLKAMGARHRTPYSTRHTRASRMLMSQCNPAWCAQQMGHSVEMFLRIYADWIDADDRGVQLAKVDGAIRPAIVHGGRSAKAGAK